MKIKQNLTKDLLIEYDTEIPRFALYQYGEEIESSTIQPFILRLKDFVKAYDLIAESSIKGDDL